MPLVQLFAIDVVAISILTFAIYFPRHRHRELVLALLGINIGVLGVTQALSSAEISAGLGLGLFGVLSIIRLRSAEMDQGEVAYYFAALTLGLLGGFPVTPGWASPALMAAILVAVFVGDHPALFRRYRTSMVTLDHAYPNESDMHARLAQLLGSKIHRTNVLKLDLVNDLTLVDVRYELNSDIDRVGPTGHAARPEYLAPEVSR
jgi:hypothetical protein